MRTVSLRPIAPGDTKPSSAGFQLGLYGFRSARAAFTDHPSIAGRPRHVPDFGVVPHLSTLGSTAGSRLLMRFSLVEFTGLPLR